MEEMHAPVVVQDLLQNDEAVAHDTPWDTCASHKDCDSCLNASYTCHFCQSDFQCHTIGSISGCAVGVSACHHLEDCERSDPQYVGYGPPPSVVIAVLCLIVTLTCCFCGISAICSVFCRERKPPSRRAELAAALKASKRNKSKKPTLKDDEDRAQAQRQPLLLEEIREGEVRLFENEVDQESLERLSSRYRQDERQVSWQTFAARTTWLTLLITMTVLALMFYPRVPDYNVCNREFEWESILHSMMSLTPKVDYQILVSVINENRFGFVLESGRADIYHNSTLVGKWELEKEWEAAAGSISDKIAAINIEPGFAEGIALWQDFSRNELIFRINASITGSITWGRYKIYRISSSTPDVEFLVGAEYDRGLCKCTEFLTPT
ncbi:hypothetical protein BBO99_00004326 [Phytophthora kernoviae]|uniref:PSI domain-containing protein n=2 Tax=Phytophthora kernoviae TaxID=325452 RepID=A0A3R7NH87_9STRA|nr:hypothetical protein G195_003108 [Phytophthora kernoviae 00238/432]KAG2526026.1 hypothetical protein JM16_002505 [Phytophthora kernoviae]KAG2527730.1 hypothetical protein JM18_002313 [Phytophthora kernoviae]RLN10951.1 hypothetical protein BBI17_000756 [Phytophthora kernoviae]RLN80654.1 hypothetical protein BBO99_00004326 [Phytophthora kernoviae]